MGLKTGDIGGIGGTAYDRLDAWGDATITWDAANGGLKIDKGLYSQSYISANGAPSAQNISETE